MLLLFSFLTAHVRYRFNVGCQSIVTLSEFDTKRCEKLLAQFIERRRPPPNIRAELDLAFRINGQNVEIFEVRSFWKDKGKKLEHSIAKATYSKIKRNWKCSGPSNPCHR
jgi:hypothetical protein